MGDEFNKNVISCSCFTICVNQELSERQFPHLSWFWVKKLAYFGVISSEIAKESERGVNELSQFRTLVKHIFVTC